MKYLDYSFIKIFFFISLFGCSQAKNSDATAPVVVTARSDDKEIIVEIKNTTNSAIELKNADVSSVIPGDPGIFFYVRDHSGEMVKMCAMVEPAYPPDFLTDMLNPSGVVSTKIEIQSLVRRFCLRPGEYEFSAVFAQKNYEVVSNAVKFSVGLEK